MESKSKRRNDNKVFICDVCLAIHHSKSGLRIHMYRHFDDGIYTCNQCPSKPVFYHSKLFERHLKQIHCARKPHKCKYCSASYKVKSQLDAHMIKHSDVRSFCCPHCDSRYKRQQHLRAHIKSVHAASDSERSRTVFICDLCGKELLSKSNLRRHFYCHYPDGHFSCELCNRVFEHSQLYRLHKTICLLPTEKRTTARFHCDWCNRDFLTKFRYESHMVVHSPDKNFSCTQCPKRFKRKRHLQLHIRTVHEKTKKVAPNKPQKREKIVFRTEGERSCVTCRKIFEDIESLEKHFIIFHNPTTPYLNAAKRKKEQKYFQCEHCNAVYEHKCRLKDHMLSHSNERNVGCNYCEKRLKSKYHLQCHIKRCHIDEQKHTVLLIMCDEKFERIVHQETRIFRITHQPVREEIFATELYRVNS